MIILGSKCDIVEGRVVSHEELQKEADSLNVELFETSAKQNINVDKAFGSIMDKVYNICKINKEDGGNKNGGIKLGEGKEDISAKKGCCK